MKAVQAEEATISHALMVKLVLHSVQVNINKDTDFPFTSLSLQMKYYIHKHSLLYNILLDNKNDFTFSSKIL